VTPKMPVEGHAALQYFDEAHIKDIFRPENIASIPTRLAAQATAQDALRNGGKAVSAIFMVAVNEDGHFWLYRFRREGRAASIWDFGNAQ
jgi:hypothetical protein